MLPHSLDAEVQAGAVIDREPALAPAAADAAIGVSILIASIGRATLIRTIESTRAAARAAGIAHEIVLADDSPSRRVASYIERMGIDTRDIRLIHTGASNISVARNACLAGASGTFVAFIDDDEWVAEDWLIRHLRAIEEFGADGSLAAVRACYGENAPQWVRRADPFSRGPRDRGATLGSGSTANGVVRREAIVGRDLRFDAALGRTGGEDVDLFGRLTRAGGRLVTSDAVVDEDIPADRCTLGYLLPRALRHGQTYARTSLVTRGRGAAAIFYADAAVKMVASAVAVPLALPLGRARALPPLLSATRNMGKLRQLLRRDLVTYYKPST